MNIRKTFLLKLFLGTTTISPKTTSVATQTLATSNTTRTTPRVWEYELGIKILANEGINQIYDTWKWNNATENFYFSHSYRFRVYLVRML